MSKRTRRRLTEIAAKTVLMAGMTILAGVLVYQFLPFVHGAGKYTWHRFMDYNGFFSGEVGVAVLALLLAGSFMTGRRQRR